MGRGPHLYRRGSVYYWQRRVPNQFAKSLRISHVKMNLKTKDVAIARRLVAHLDARASEVFTVGVEMLSKEQLGEIFKSALRAQHAKLCLFADLERAHPTAPRATLLEDELAQGVAYTLLAEQGVDARLDPAGQERLMKNGHGGDFIIKVIEHIERLRDEDGILLSHGRLASHIKAVGGEINASNLTRAQPVYLRALGAALLSAHERYSTEPKQELDFDALIEQSIGDRPPPAELEAMAPSSRDQRKTQNHIVAPVVTAEKQNAEPSERTILFVGHRLESKRAQDSEWDKKTVRQARFVFSLFARFMHEVYNIDDLCLVRQNHLAEFDQFLRALHSNFGKSPLDQARTIAEIRELATADVPKHGTLQGATRNRHLTFLGQLIAFARGGGLNLERDLSLTPFRARKSTRGRDQRSVPNKPQIVALFHRPLFIGYSHCNDIDTPGTEFYHRAEYYGSLIAFYEGARREEYCGLGVDDVIVDNGEPYLHIAPNDFRRIKNAQSVRNLALHPELIRLGFLKYVEAIRELGYLRLFPDLYSPSTGSPLGDRLYDQLLPSLQSVGFGPHQMRHFFGDRLKQGAVSKEFRADLLGHGGESETTERYCNPLDIELQLPYLMKLPIVTEHLENKPIKLLPWVVAKEIAPWSKAGKLANRQKS